MVKELRDKTNAGMMDCKQALSSAEGNLEKAIEYLRKKGLSAATKRSSRAAKDGMVASYIHMEGKIGVMVEVNCETDFVAKTDNFRAMVKGYCDAYCGREIQTYLNPDDVPEEVMEQEKSIYREQALAEGKPEKIVDKIIDGKIKKFYEEVCLLEQKFVKDMDITIQTLVNNMIANTGENIVLRRFSRYQLGEDI